MKRIFLLMMAALLLAGCEMNPSAAGRAENVLVASWNLQAMFDGNDDGVEYAEYRESAGWNEEKYRSRLIAAAKAIKTLDADIMTLVEIENAAVAQALAEETGLGWNFFAKTPGYSLGVGIMSRYPIIQSRTHAAFFDGVKTPRPIAEAWIDVGGETVVLLACHWKSKLGGGGQTEKVRRAEAALLGRRIAEIEAAHPGMMILAAGDLNESWDEFSRCSGAYLCALMPDTEEAAELAAAAAGKMDGCLFISGEKPPREGVLFSAWMENSGFEGTFYYKEQWDAIDHLMLNRAAFDGAGLDYAEFTVVRTEPFAKGGIPHSYAPWTGRGLSDHFPVTVRLVR
jgi:endonuclease/exonuclease/phosphatase family metal-dependent hydrolase